MSVTLVDSASNFPFRSIYRESYHPFSTNTSKSGAKLVQWADWAKEIQAGKRQSFVSMLEERGLFNSVIGDRDTLDHIITNKRVGMYAGIDPTAPSIHVGHMLPFMVLGWAYVHGMKAVWLLGGATSKVGDPTGRTKSRPVLGSASRKAYIASMHQQLKKLGRSYELYGKKYGYEYEWAWRRVLENNNAWWNKQPLVEVMTVLGTHARVGPMLGREPVKTRLESGSGGGMSFAELCYPMMQAWDFWQLYQKGVTIQIGGSDQHGNIQFGVDMIKQILKTPSMEVEELGRLRPASEDPELSKPIGFTVPLLTTSTGEKIGKSAGNSIWLDKDMTSVYDLYQYFVRLADSDIERYLKLFTFLPLPRIQEIMVEHNKDHSLRVAQHALAKEFVELIHGPEEAATAEKSHRTIFLSKTAPSIDGDTLASSASPLPAGNGPTPAAINQGADQTTFHPNLFNAPSPNLVLPRSQVVGQTFHKILHTAGMVPSKQEGHRLIVNNGARVGSMSGGNAEMGDALQFAPIKIWPGSETEKYLIDGSLLILKVGKWKIKIIKVLPDEDFKAEGYAWPDVNAIHPK
ncbi:tyrosyl-tRNA synthetase [Myotisia sp. PD_48]|nr:tyrosyl-tRNA synthetase [Myotisia sp. PD_48]